MMRPERNCRAGHHLLAAHVNAGMRLFDRCNKTDTCWIWTGPRNPNGYGLTNIKTRKGPTHAHRAAYALTHGSVPAGFLVRHSCDNPPCINPAHLSIGTNQENNKDMLARRRALWQRDRYCRRGHFVKANSGKCLECAAINQTETLAEKHERAAQAMKAAFDAYFDQHIRALLPESFEELLTITDDRRATLFARAFGLYGFTVTIGARLSEEYGITRERVRQLRNDVMYRLGVPRDVVRKIPSGWSWKVDATQAA